MSNKNLEFLINHPNIDVRNAAKSVIDWSYQDKLDEMASLPGMENAITVYMSLHDGKTVHSNQKLVSVQTIDHSSHQKLFKEMISESSEELVDAWFAKREGIS